MATASSLVTWLRAAGEATRLRLLSLCAERDLSVSDLAEALRQSEPRVSRHLKILSEAGLIERLRHGQWVHYQVTRGGAAAAFVHGLLAQLDRSDATLTRDRESLHPKTAAAPIAPAGETRLGRALRAFMDAEVSNVVAGSVLIVGVEHPEILSATAGERCVALAHSRRAAQTARAFAEREQLNCGVLVMSSPHWSMRDAEKAGQPFAAVVLDRLVAARDLASDLAVARQTLPAHGRLWLFEKYESLESPRGRVVEHPIGKIRRILSEAGFTCQRLSPIEADGEHVLAASAVAAQEFNVRIA